MARILQVCNTDFYLERFLKPLVLELRRRGHEVDCICSGRGVSKELAARGVGLHEAEYPKKSTPWNFLRSIFAFERFLRAHRYDCVNSHNRNSSIVARVACWRAGVPLSVYTAHGMYYHDGQGPLARRLTESLEGALARITDFTLSQSDEDTLHMVATGRIARDKIETIGNGINVVKFGPRERAVPAGIGPSPGFRVAALGRLVQGKGFEDLIHAFHRLQEKVPGAELVFIGGNIEADFDSSADSMGRLVKELGLEKKVRITGIVDNVDEYLAVSDVFVHPSYREGMPRSLLEAMCVGLPVIATAIRGAREILRDGENGFLFPPRDPAALAARLDRVYAMSAAQRRAMGTRARELVLGKFDERAYITRQADALERLLREKERNPHGIAG
jgi:glycosyltransferase involved in cell wall biosynthesis